MELFIAEKPSLAQAIMHGLGGGEKKDGFFQCGDKIVTWCFGHILENFSPEDYDPKYKKWSLATLPITPKVWQLKVKSDCKKQFNIIKGLVKKANVIVNAGDPDREGQLLVDEVLEYIGVFQEKKIIKRILLNALDDKSVKQALSNLQDNQKFLGLRHSALARSRADWFLGMNMTRFFSIKSQTAGYTGVMSVGRVQTPTIALIVRREEEIKNFKPVKHYSLRVIWQHENGSFAALWKPKENCPWLDAEGRLLNKTVIENLVQRIGIGGKISTVKQERGESQPRLPYSLSALQIEAGKKYGYSPQEVLDAQQSLYEKKLATYPRSDCDYLPENQLSDAPIVLKNLQNISPEFHQLVLSADVSLRSKAWNDKKISAHHAIIPTTVQAEIYSLSEIEKNLYEMISKAYIAQFYPPQKFLSTTVTIRCDGETFLAAGKMILEDGWKKIYNGEAKDEDQEEGENEKIPPVREGDEVRRVEQKLIKKITQPPKRFTAATLLKAMKEIGKYVKDPKLKPILKDCSGIGTEATRAGIIETLAKREYVTVKKKEFLPTEKAYTLIKVLPESFTYPDITAIWEHSLDAISKNELSYADFGKKQMQLIKALFRDAEAIQISAPQNIVKCPKCGKPMVRRKSAKGFFWGCSGYPDCKTISPYKQERSLSQR